MLIFLEDVRRTIYKFSSSTCLLNHLPCSLSDRYYYRPNVTSYYGNFTQSQSQQSNWSTCSKCINIYSMLLHRIFK